MIRIAISGAGGRMGQTLFECVKRSTDFSIVFGVDTFKCHLPYPVFDSFDSCALTADVVVDFSNPSALDGILSYAEKTGAKVVLATTGYSNEQLERIRFASTNVAIFLASNMSLGVNLLTSLAKDTAKFLGSDYDVEIVETHHNKKVDAPSGTALSLAKAINGVRDNSLDFTFGRGGVNGRNQNQLGIHSIRGGTAIGKHTVMFLGTGEVISLCHEAENKDVFGMGALQAVKYLMGKKSGLYNMANLTQNYAPALSISTDKNLSLLTIPSMSESDCVSLFKDVNGNGLDLDDVSVSTNIDGSLRVSVALKNNIEKFAKLTKNAKNQLLEQVGKITLFGTKNNSVIFEVFRLMKAIGAKIYMSLANGGNISLYIDSDKLIQGEYALKSYVKL